MSQMANFRVVQHIASHRKTEKWSEPYYGPYHLENDIKGALIVEQSKDTSVKPMPKTLLKMSRKTEPQRYRKFRYVEHDDGTVTVEYKKIVIF